MTTVSIGLDGIPVLEKEGSRESFDFNAYYKGYFPACRWTAAGSGKLLYLAGTDSFSVPHLFCSSRGDVWTEVPIWPQIRLLQEKDYGDILRILYDPQSRVVFLVTEGGCLVTLPDCPKCVRARKVSASPLVDGRIEGDQILLFDRDGQELSFFLYTEVQYRCSYAFAEPYLQNGGILVDLRKQPDFMETQLSSVPKETPLFFLCHSGALADAAAREAREKGYDFAYSLGSAADL